MPDQNSPGNDNIDALDKIGRDVRRAILSALPCAADQYVTISIPGRVIDTKRGGEFVRSETPSAGELHQIRVNEAKLVDSMIPLDTVMLGPTGKSVARSYLAALDFLIPIDSEVRLPSMTPKETQEKPSNYMTAMNYLRKPLPGYSEGEKKKTVVDIYVEKQKEYTAAQSAWDALQDKNAEDLQRTEGMTAEELEKRQSRMRKARFELQARWMDWVVNGDKILVDHHFAVVDISTVMARIEASKESARAANIMDLINGTQWAQVTLEPKDWAYYCRQKALSWAGKNPLSPAVIELEIKRLRTLKTAYEGYMEGAVSGTNALKPEEKPTGTADSETGLTKAIKDVNKAQGELDVLTKEGVKPEDERVKTAEKSLAAAKAELHALEKNNQHKGVVNALDAATSKGMQASLARKISELDQEITKLQGHLTESGRVFERGVNAIVGVKRNGDEQGKGKEKAIEGGAADGSATDGIKYIMANEGETAADKNLLAGGPSAPETPDPWTKVVFTSSTESENASSSEKAISAEAKAKIGGLFWGAEASTSYSSVSKELRQESSKHKISGSFSALLVKITRPWLHAELFSDYEIDAPQNPKISPGPVKFKQWLNDRNQTELGKFEQFPAYPTAFIVAAETELEIECGKSFASRFMESSSTDSKLAVDYGPWCASASANLKTESQSTNQRMEATATGMKISFQAPQIIGWVSEILPELPRNKDPLAPGGLVGAPMNLFRR